MTQALKRRIAKLEDGLRCTIDALSTAADHLEDAVEVDPAAEARACVRDAIETLGLPVDEYTVTEREDAAAICDVLAASFASGQTVSDNARRTIAKRLGASARSRHLSEAAFYAVPPYNENNEEVAAHEQEAEAAAWIRSGWSPGDEWNASDPIGPATPGVVSFLDGTSVLLEVQALAVAIDSDSDSLGAVTKMLAPTDASLPSDDPDDTAFLDEPFSFSSASSADFEEIDESDPDSDDALAHVDHDIEVDAVDNLDDLYTDSIGGE